MNNPWFALPQEAPFVLEIDREAVDLFNATTRDQPDYQLHTELMPEPYLGDPVNAPVILLNLNPGYSEEDVEFYADLSRRRACRDNLEHKSAQYPFFFLHPDFPDCCGTKWWRGKLKQLIAETSVEQVAQNICCIEYFPYHSRRFKSGKLTLESQHYSFELVRKAVDARKIIVMMRARRYWEEAVPALKTYDYYHLRSAQNVSITRGNISDGGFDLIKEALV